MIAEVVRIITDWLEDDNYGINAQLARLESDGLIDTNEIPPDVAFIGNQFDDNIVAEWNEPQKKPAVYITMGGAIDFSGIVITSHHRTAGADRATPVDIRYIAAKADIRKVLLNTSYTLRAIARSLSVLNLSENSNNRKKNEIFLIAMHELLMGHLFDESVGDSMVSGAVMVSYEIQDKAPQGV